MSSWYGKRKTLALDIKVCLRPISIGGKPRERTNRIRDWEPMFTAAYKALLLLLCFLLNRYQFDMRSISPTGFTYADAHRVFRSVCYSTCPYTACEVDICITTEQTKRRGARYGFKYMTVNGARFNTVDTAEAYIESIFRDTIPDPAAYGGMLFNPIQPEYEFDKFDFFSEWYWWQR